MSPPFFADFGKSARDSFSKGYHFNLIKLDIKCKTTSGAEFTFGGVKNIETRKIVGHLDAKYKFEEYGTTFSEKWNTDGVLGTDVTVEDWVEGLKATLETTFQPRFQGEAPAALSQSSVEGVDSFKRAQVDKSFRLKFHYKQKVVAANVEGEVKVGMDSMVRAGIAAGYDLFGIVASGGVSGDLNVNRLTVPKYEIGAQIAVNDFVASVSLANLNVVSATVFHSLDGDLESGFMGSWSLDGQQDDLVVGCKLKLEDDAAVRVKVTRQAVIGVGYSQKFSEGVTVHLSAMLSGFGTKMYRGESSLGLCIELTA